MVKSNILTVAWYEQPKWVAVIVVASLAVGYVSLLQALNTGSLWLYTLMFISLYIAIDRIIHAAQARKQLRRLEV